MEAAQWAALALSGAASVFDLRARRIPNALSLGAAVLAVGYHAIDGGPTAGGAAVAGWLVGVALFFPLFALGGMGAGDVKLLGACGAWLGPRAALWIALYASLAGGVLAIAVALVSGYLGRAVSNVWTLLAFWRTAGVRPHPELVLAESKGPRLAFSIPIGVGVLLTVWLQ